MIWCIIGPPRWHTSLYRLRFSLLDVERHTTESVLTAAFSLLGQYVTLYEKQESSILQVSILFFILLIVLGLNINETDFWLVINLK